MQTFHKITLMCCMFLMHTLPAIATEDISAQEIMAVGKMTGACGILDSMISFQKTTRMEGGEAFVLRFWEVEAARLGMSVQQLSNQCNQSILTYDKLWSSAGSAQ